MTVTVWLLAAESDGEGGDHRAGSVSVTVTLLITSDGVTSLSVIVPMPWLSAIVALLGRLRFT